jgi:hypothetical protein
MKTKSTSMMMLSGMLVLAAALGACQKHDEAGPGPAEKAGAKIDSATSQAAQEMNKAGEKAGQMMQDAGKSVQDKAQEAQQKQDAQK